MLFLHEWALVLFTLLVQTAVGIVMAGECLIRQTEGETRTAIRRQSCVAFVFFAVAGIVSLGHTGSPLNSFYTLFNVGSSWLSREIAVLSLTGMAFLWLAYMRFRKPEQASEKTAAFLVIVAGLILIAVMSRVYRLSVAPAWDSFSGLAAFFGSTFLMGGLWMGMVLRKADVCSAKNNGAGALASFAFVGLTLAAVSLPLGIPTTDAGVNPNTVLIPASCVASSLALRILLTGLGVAVFVMSLLRAAKSGCASACGPVAAFLLVLAGELLGRSVFYLSYARLGM